MEIALRTSEVRAAATEKTRDGLRNILKQLVPLNNRKEQLDLLKRLKASADPDTQHFLQITQEREEHHRLLMKKIVPKIEGITKKDQHDFSKDELFFFAAASYYDGGIDGEDIRNMIGEELKRHHSMEAHHPEYELYNDAECLEADIIEMAIDRLCRNAQYGNGIIDLEMMKQFVPKFSRGECETKSKIFWDAVEEYHGLVQSEFLETFPNAKDWKKDSESEPVFKTYRRLKSQISSETE